MFVKKDFTFRKTDWGKSGVDNELLGSSGVNTSSFVDRSILILDSIDDVVSKDGMEIGKSSEFVSAKVT